MQHRQQRGAQQAYSRISQVHRQGEVLYPLDSKGENNRPCDADQGADSDQQEDRQDKSHQWQLPLRESVVVCKTDTTIDQLRKYCDRRQKQWGITALQIHIHLDEGHYGIPRENSTWKPNCHAHIVWDWMNHNTGKSYKLGKEDMSLMQDMVAECLEMERGTRKEKTGKDHLERMDFVVSKQKREAEEAATKKKSLDHENQVREKSVRNWTMR